MGGGAKIPYPKHVWSPSGGWYCQPSNWKANTAAFGAVVLGIAGTAFYISSQREFRHSMPEPGRFFPSRHWSKQILGHEAAQKAKKESSS